LFGGTKCMPAISAQSGWACPYPGRSVALRPKIKSSVRCGTRALLIQTDWNCRFINSGRSVTLRPKIKAAPAAVHYPCRSALHCSLCFRSGWSFDLLNILIPFSRPARRARCSPAGRSFSSIQVSLQQPCNFSAHSSHCMKSRWQPSFLQLVCVSQGLPQVWHSAITSSVMRSPSRSSNTKFLPMNCTGSPSCFALRVYSIMPPST